MALFFVLAPGRGAQATTVTQTTYADFTGSSATWSGLGSTVTATVGDGAVQLGYRGAEPLDVVPSTNAIPTSGTSPYGLGSYGMAAWNGRVYVAGGSSCNPSCGYGNSAVYSAPILNGGTLGTWRTESSLAVGEYRIDEAMTAWNGRLYLVGGYSYGAGACNAYVQSAAINADGTLGSWSTLTSYPYSTDSAGVSAWNGWLYVAGGKGDCGAGTTDVYAAPIKSDGTIGSWVSQSALPSANAWVGTVAYNGVLYAVGGYVNAGPTYASAAVYSAVIGANGTLGSWSTQTNSLPLALYAMEATVFNGRLYVAGGSNNLSVVSQSVFSAPISGDGSVGVWRKEAAGLPVGGGGMSVILNGNLIFSPMTLGAAPVTLPLDVGGSIPNSGTWSANSTSLPDPIGDEAATAYGGRLQIAGPNNATGALTVSSSALVNADGSVAALTQGPSLLQNGSGRKAVVIDGWEYAFMANVVGGTGNVPTMNYAQLCSTGTYCGTWQNGTVPFSNWRDSFDVIAFSTAIYLIGGEDYGCGSHAEVYFAAVSPTGGLAAGWTATTSIPSGHYRGNGVAWNGYLYHLGGAYSGCYQVATTDVYYAPINADGTITSGSWNSTTAMPATNESFSVEVWDGAMYLIGGNINNSNNPWGSYTSAVYRAQINADGSLGSWVAVASLPSGRVSAAGHITTKWLGDLYVVGGITGDPNVSTSYTNTIYYAGVSSYAARGSYFNTLDLGSDQTLSAVSWNATLNGGTLAVSVSTASSSSAFSPWLAIASGASLNASTVRYVRYRVDMSSSSTNATPVLTDITANPVATTCTYTPPNSFTFTDTTLTTDSSVIRGVHITDLRAAINTLQTNAGLTASTWTDTIAPRSTLVRAVHITEMRAALNAVYTACGQTPPTYTDSTLTPGFSLVRAVHINDLRAAVNNAK